MKQQEESQGIDTLKGVSLTSLLQVLEQESKSCTLLVKSGELEGCFFFDEGVLVDALCEEKLGADAAYTILLWDNPVFALKEPEDRMRRIHLPLAYIILNSAKQKDEDCVGADKDECLKSSVKRLSGSMASHNPVIQKLIQLISSLADVKHYFLLNRQGQMIIQSSKKMKISDFVAYSIVSGVQMGEILNVKGPNQIQFVLDDGETLLIVPKAGTIIGMLVDEQNAVDGILDELSDIPVNV